MVAHNDPEWETMTYGDLCNTNARASNLKKVQTGDYLFFLARLEYHDGSRFTGGGDFYFVGYFHIKSVYPAIDRPLTPAEEIEIGRNAHVLRAKANPSLWADERLKFWVFKGDANSVRFRYALRADWKWLTDIFRDAYGYQWSEKSSQSRLQRIASYTRTIRCQLDPNDPEQKSRYERFWEKVQSHLYSTGY